MSSPEAHPQEQPLSAEQQDIWRVLVKKKALRSLEALEAFYLSEEEQKFRKNTPLTNERYQEWLSWMEEMEGDPKALFRQHMFVDEGALAEKSKAFMDAMEALEELRATKHLSEGTKQKLSIEIREGEFLVPVDYVIPPIEELRRRFPGHVNPAFRGILFEPIEVCKGVSREASYILCEYVHLGRAASNDEVLAEMERRGLRPCLPEELIAFGLAYPEEQRKFLILALGSEASVRGSRCVACLWGDDDGRYLRLGWFDGDWDGYCRFLAVRK